MGYPREEQETSCSYDHVTKEWSIYSTVRKHITKLLKSCGEPYWKETEIGTKGAVNIVAGKWKVNGNQVRFFSPRVAKEEDEDFEEVEEAS